MSRAKDMTQVEFGAACVRHGFRTTGILGYYSLPGTQTSVSVLNAGGRRRDRLAYLIQQQRMLIAKATREGVPS